MTQTLFTVYYCTAVQGSVHGTQHYWMVHIYLYGQCTMENLSCHKWTCWSYEYSNPELNRYQRNRLFWITKGASVETFAWPCLPFQVPWLDKAKIAIGKYYKPVFFLFLFTKTPTPIGGIRLGQRNRKEKRKNNSSNL